MSTRLYPGRVVEFENDSWRILSADHAHPWRVQVERSDGERREVARMWLVTAMAAERRTERDMDEVNRSLRERLHNEEMQ